MIKRKAVKLLCLTILVIILSHPFTGVPDATDKINAGAPVGFKIAESPGTLESHEIAGNISIKENPEISTITPFKLTLGSDKIGSALIKKMERHTAIANEISETYTITYMGSIWGYLTYDTYSFMNGDLYYYLKYMPRNNEAGEITINLSYLLESFDLRTIEYPEGLNQNTSIIKLYEAQSIGKNVLNGSLPPGSIYIDSDILHCFFSYTSVYKRGSYNIREELYDKSKGLSVTSSGITVKLPSGGVNSFSEQWGTISKGKLVDWNDKFDVDTIKAADLSRVKKWGGDGQYYNLPVGYSPYSPNGFYRNNANHVGNAFITVDGRLFEDFAYVTMDTLVKTQNNAGYWGTSPLSDWLYKDYKIGAGFFDTRWDTEAALSLLRGYRKFNDPMALEAACTYADFYCDFALKQSYKTKNGGILVYDYGFDAMPGIKAHTSLNHLVNEISFILEMYITTQNKAYLATAKQILEGIHDTSSAWMNKSNGDLYYAYFGNGKYGRTDYPTLTLNDLRYAQSLVKKVFRQEDAVIAKLLTIKEKYLTAHHIVY